jgi:proteasome lid subunit RPN8/RPN11
MPPASPTDAFSLASLERAQAIGTLYRGAAVVVIREQALEQILDFSAGELTREVGGFLLGGVYGPASPSGSDAQYVVVRHFHPAFEAESGSASLKFTHESWSILHREIEQRFPEEAILGWQHTHPGFGIFLSAYDLFIHRNFFSQPWQIALVVDPQRQELGFFHWRAGEVQDCGFLNL